MCVQVRVHVFVCVCKGGLSKWHIGIVWVYILKKQSKCEVRSVFVREREREREKVVLVNM